MSEEFFDNLTSVTNNLNDITFTKYANITEINDDNTVNCREKDTDTLHTNVPSVQSINHVDDTVVLGFVDNDVYSPVLLGNITHSLSKYLESTDRIYPVGTVYFTYNDDFNPNTQFTGVWEQVEPNKWVRLE